MSQGSWRTGENLDFNEMLTANYTSEQERSIWHCRASFSNCLVEEHDALQMKRWLTDGYWEHWFQRQPGGRRQCGLLSLMGFYLCSPARASHLVLTSLDQFGRPESSSTIILQQDILFQANNACSLLVVYNVHKIKMNTLCLNPRNQTLKRLWLFWLKKSIEIEVATWC